MGAPRLFYECRSARGRLGVFWDRFDESGKRQPALFSRTCRPRSREAMLRIQTKLSTPPASAPLNEASFTDGSQPRAKHFGGLAAVCLDAHPSPYGGCTHLEDSPDDDGLIIPKYGLMFLLEQGRHCRRQLPVRDCRIGHAARAGIRPTWAAPALDRTDCAAGAPRPSWA